MENILSLENGFAFQSEYFVEEKTGYVVATPGNVSVEGGFICEGGKNYSVSAPFNERFIFKSGDIFVTMTDLTPTANTLGKPAIVPDNGIIYLHNQRLGKLVDYNCNKKFLFALLCTDKYHSQIVKTASGTTVRHSSPDKILSYETFVPKFEEQKMIGKFFSNLDHFIALHQRKQCILYIMEKLLCGKSKQLEKSISWEQRKLGELVDRVVRKNTNNESTLPLTISAQYGLVDQITYFNNRVASRDVSNYYLVLNGEFAYNKSTSDGYPFGAVKRLDLYEKGVLSTLYIIFATKKEQQIDSDFLTVFFDTDRWHKGIAERAAEGARNHGLLNISTEDFFDIDLSIPQNVLEQKQIGTFIRQFDNLITLHQRKP